MDTEFGRYNNHLIILKEQLPKLRTTLEIVFTSGAIRAHITMEVLQDPSADTCKVTPPFGYGFITYFDITCEGFGSDEDSAKRPSLEFEYAQFSKVSDRKNSMMYLGRSFSGKLDKVALAPGLDSVDYVTVVIVYARDKEGFVETSEYDD